MGRIYAKDIPLTGGIQKDTSDLAGDGFLTLQNISRYKRDAIRRRPGLATRIETAGIVMSGLRINSTDCLVQMLNTGEMVYHQTSYDASVVTVVNASLVTSATYGVFAHAGSDLYFANGVDAPRYISAVASTGTIGLAAPSNDMPTPTLDTSSTGVTAGDHLIRYRYISVAKGYWSDPSGVVKFTASAAGALVWCAGTTATTITAPTDGRVDRIQLEITKANGTEFYAATEQSTWTTGTAVRITWNDQQMAASNYIFNYPEAAAEDVGNAPPPTLEYVAEHRGRLFGLLSGYLYWSQYGRPHSWNSAQAARSVFQSSDDQGTGLCSVDSDLYCFGRYSIWRFAYNALPDEGVLTQVPTKVGLWHQRLLVKAEGRTYGWGPAGIWQISVMMPKIISEAIRPVLTDEVDYDYVSQFHAVQDPEDRVILFFYVPEGETTCTGCLVWDYVNGEWRTNAYPKALQASYLLTKQGGQSRAFVADADDYTWHLENSLKDGVTSGSNSKFTAASTCTTTTITTNETAQTSETLVGTYLYRVNDGTSRRITANTANSITVASAFSTATVTSGEELWAGSVEMIVEPKWLTAPDPYDKMRLHGLAFHQIPDTTSTGTWWMYHYRNFGTVADTLNIETNDKPPLGQSLNDGNTYSEVDIDQQFVGARYCPSDWSRSIKLKLWQRDPDCNPTLTRLTYRYQTHEGGAE